MKDLISELIGQLTNKEIELTDVFIKAKVLAFKLKNDELKTWVENELNGYLNSDVPEYRILGCSVMGTISNGHQRATNYPIPLTEFDKELKEDIQKVKFAQSISTLDDFIQNGESNKMATVIPSEMYTYLSDNLGNGYHVEFARREIHKTQIIQTLTTIRSKFLDFLMQLEEEIEQDHINSIQDENSKDKVAALFQSSVFGDNTTIIVGDNNNQTVTNITAGDFETLKKSLKKAGIEENDISELQSIIDADNLIVEKKEFGTKVKSWVSQMLNKAMDGTWQIGLGAGGKLLSEGIMRYYGWK